MKKLLLILLCLPFIGFGQEINKNTLVSLEKDTLVSKQELGALLTNKNKDKNILMPYPVIFIHGLRGDWESWEPFHEDLGNWGWSWGGYLDFCLNSVNSISGNNSGNQQDFCNINSDITNLTTNLNDGDYYVIDFDCDPTTCVYSDGSVLSNQAAIILQGRALGEAIDMVLQQTGTDKVILMGHSMGGLAAREYIQNSSHWLSSSHRVAKLITSGTPHGGSNYSWNGIFASIEKTDASRDLRSSYISGYSGAYLFGNIAEDGSQIYAFSPHDYNNVDVNCDATTGFISSSDGLNNKQIPTVFDPVISQSFADIDYACIWGDNDLVVSAYSANLRNQYPNDLEFLELFLCDGCSHQTWALQWPNPLTSKDYINFKALDEPEYFWLSYNIDLGALYTGYLTYQDINHPDQTWGTDLDSYHFFLNQSSNTTIQVNNLNTNGKLELYDDSYNLLYSVSSNFSGYASIQYQLPAGKFYIDISGDAYGTSSGNLAPWNNPYTFSIWDDPLSLNNELGDSQKRLLKVVDLLGRETEVKTKESLFYIYDDGTVEKKIIFE